MNDDDDYRKQKLENSSENYLRPRRRNCLKGWKNELMIPNAKGNETKKEQRKDGKCITAIR